MCVCVRHKEFVFFFDLHRYVHLAWARVADQKKAHEVGAFSLCAVVLKAKLEVCVFCIKSAKLKEISWHVKTLSVWSIMLLTSI